MAAPLLRATLLARLALTAQISPDIYSRIAESNQPMFDKIVSLVVEELGLDGSGSVLDIGCGPGEPTLTLARAAPHATIKCTDFQSAMVDKAKGRIAAFDSPQLNLGERISFDRASADDLANVSSHVYDVVMANYVLMFVPDRAKAMREFRRVLRPAKTAVVSYWKQFSLCDVALEAIRQVAGPEVQGFSLDPLALKEDGVVHDLAKDASFTVAATHSVTYDFPLGTIKEATDALLMLAGDLLRQQEAKQPGATKHFYEVAEKLFREKRWVRADGRVVLPQNTAELVVLKNGDRSEL